MAPAARVTKTKTPKTPDKPRVSRARARDKEATRAAILETALTIFSERGYEAGSTREIAALVNVNHAMVKYYFASKEDLWKATVTFLFERMAEEISFSLEEMEQKTGAAARAFAKEIWGDYIRYCARHPDHARLMIQVTIRAGPRLDWAIDTFIMGQRERGERLVAWMQRNDLVPKVSTPALLFSIVGASQMYYILGPEVQKAWGFDPHDAPRVEDHVEALLALIFR